MYASNIKQKMGQIYANHMSPLPFGLRQQSQHFPRQWPAPNAHLIKSGNPAACQEHWS